MSGFDFFNPFSNATIGQQPGAYGNMNTFSGSYFNDLQQPQFPNAMSANTWFWETPSNLTKSNGTRVSGTYRELYLNHTDLQPQIMGFYESLTVIDDNFGGQPTLGAAPSPPLAQDEDVFGQFINTDGPEKIDETVVQPRETLFDAVNGVETGTPVESAAEASPDRRGENSKPSVSSKADSPPHSPPIESSTVSDSTLQSAPGTEQAESDAKPKTIGDSETESTTPAAEEVQRRPVPTAPMQPAMGNPQYIADISTADEAREIVDGRDPRSRQKLNLADDDFEDFRVNKLHFYSKQLFDAMLTPGVETPADSHLNADAKKKFTEQQSSNLKKIQNLLKTSAQQKEARANCILAFEAAAFVHEVGVPKDMCDQYMETGYRKSDRYIHLDADSICSKRLEKMISIVRSYKLIAYDLASGKKLQRLALDADWYAEQKIVSLVSNTTRDKQAKKIKAMGKKLEDAGVDVGVPSRRRLVPKDGAVTETNAGAESCLKSGLRNAPRRA